MLLKSKQLIGLEVKTKNGQRLGRLVDLEMETETSEVKKYIVGADSWIKNKIIPELVIDSSQIIEITDQSIIVDDSLLNQAALSQIA